MTSIFPNLIYILPGIMFVILIKIIGINTKYLINKIDGLPDLITGMFMTIILYAPLITLVNLLNIFNYKMHFTVFTVALIIVNIYLCWKQKLKLEIKPMIPYFISFVGIIIGSVIYDSISSGNSMINADYNTYSNFINHANQFIGNNLITDEYMDINGNVGLILVHYAPLTAYHLFGSWVGLFGQTELLIPGELNGQFQIFMMIVTSALALSVTSKVINILKSNYRLIMYIMSSIAITGAFHFSGGLILGRMFGFISILIIILWFEKKLSWTIISLLMLGAFFWMTSVVFYLVFIIPLMLFNRERIGKCAVVVISFTQLYLASIFVFRGSVLNNLSQFIVFMIVAVIPLILFIFHNQINIIIDKLLNIFKALFRSKYFIYSIPLIMVSAYAATLVLLDGLEANPNIEVIEYQYTFIILRCFYSLFVWSLIIVAYKKDLINKKLLVYTMIVLIILGPQTKLLLTFSEDLLIAGHRVDTFALNEDWYDILNATMIMPAFLFMWIGFIFNKNPFTDEFISDYNNEI